MSNYERGRESVFQMKEIVGIEQTFNVGMRTYQDYQRAINLKLITESIEHDEFYSGFYCALLEIGEVKNA